MKAEIIVEKKKRIIWIDNIKLFAILCVVLYHSSALIINEKYSLGWIIETFNMALFFFISGYTSLRSIQNIINFSELYKFSKKRFIRILLPCMFVSLLIFQKFCSFWFLLTLFYYLVAFATFHYLCSLIKISFNWAYLFFLLLLFVDIPKIGNDQEFIIAFSLGLFFSKNKIFDNLSRFSNQKILWIILSGFIIWLSLIPFYISFYLNQFYFLLHNNTIYLL